MGVIFRMEKTKEDFNKYDNEIIDIDEVQGTDMKINPDYYIHSALLKAQQALIKDNLQEGLLQYRILIEHIEVLCRSAGKLPSNYKTEIETFEKSEEYIKEKDNLIKSVKLATKKLELLMNEVFSSKVSTEPLKGYETPSKTIR